MNSLAFLFLIILKSRLALDTILWELRGCCTPRSYWKNWCFQPNFAIFLHIYFQHWKWNAFTLISPYFFMPFFANSENATKSKFRRGMLNILSALKFAGSHLAFYEWKVSFSLISPMILTLWVCVGWLTLFWSLWLQSLAQWNTIFQKVVSDSLSINLNHFFVFFEMIMH
jgi:hypothetical protein